MAKNNEFITIGLDRLEPNEGQLEGLPSNPRQITESKMALLKQNIKQYPEMLKLRSLMVYPLENGKYIIIGGNMRYRAMSELGMKDAPCVVIPKETDIETLKAYTIIDNNGFGKYDWDMLANEWDEFELEEWGVDLPNMESDVNVDEHGNPMDEDGNAHEDEEFDEDEISEELITEEGELWQIGRHLLLCGDSTKADDVARIFHNGEQANLWLTDPPYNVGYGYEGSVRNSRMDRKDGLVVLNDKQDNEHFLMFLTDAFTQAKNILSLGSTYYIFHSDSFSYYFRQALINVGDMELRQNLIWNKNSMVLGRQDYQWKHEPILTGWREGASHHWYGDRKQTTVIDWDRPSRSVEHPTMKPVGLVGYLMKNSSKPEDIVYDGFGGSGTTLIAAEQLGRTCRMVELSPHYCKVIIWRYIQLVKKYDEVFRVNEDGTKTPISEIVDREILNELCNKKNI